VTPDEEELLRRLAMHDESVTIGAMIGTSGLIGLDGKTHALTRVAALIAAESSIASYQWAVDAALAEGATEEDIIDVLLAVAPVVGLARVTSAAPELALALGYDVEASGVE
jgi:alkylhydroperoxidase/carboxymuconolactone decarboxylase family protein YurZ